MCNRLRKFFCDALRDLVSLVQFKKREKHPANLLEVNFSHFLNCRNGIKLRKASRLVIEIFFLLYGSQVIDLDCKSIDVFLFSVNINS